MAFSLAAAAGDGDHLAPAQRLDIRGERAIGEIIRHPSALIVEERAQDLAKRAGRGHLIDFSRRHHAGRRDETLIVDLADADEMQRRLARQSHHIGDAELRQQHGFILDAVGEERNRKKIGFRARALGEAMDDVIGVGGEAAGQAAEQRDEFHCWRG